MERIFFSLCLFTLPIWGKPVRFEIKDPAQRDLVSLVSDTPLEKAVAISTAISGWIELDPDKLNDGVKGELISDIRTFDSGNALRNDFLKEKVWQASEGPALNFVLAKWLSVSKPKLSDNAPISFRLEGVAKYKGMAKVVSVLGKMTWIKQTENTLNHRGPGNLLRVSSGFDIDLTQFGFTPAEIAKARLARYLQISSDFVATDINKSS